MIDFLTDLLSLIALPLAAGLLVLSSHIPLGEQVLRRGIVFIDLAIAQIAALGVLALSGQGFSPAGALWSAALAAMLAAAAIAWLTRRWPDQREPMIGLVYVGAAALAVVWVSEDPHGAQKLRTLLAGDILWVTWTSISPLAIASATLLASLRYRPDLLAHDRWFYPVFALMISLSVPLLGLYLVFAVLIAPALGASSLRRMGLRNASQAAWGIGALGFCTGLLGSFLLDWPSGPTVTLSLVLVAGITRVASAGRLSE